MTADPAPAAGRLAPDNRTLAVARPDLTELHRLREKFTAETGLAYTIPLTLHRIISEWRHDHE